MTFLLDASDSIGANDADTYKWNLIKNFASDVTQRLDVSEFDVHVAAAKFSTDGEYEFILNRYYRAGDAAGVIRRMTLLSDTSNVAAGIREVDNRIWGRGGDRDEAPNILVIVSDGVFNDLTTATAAANAAKNRGVIIIPVGAGGDSDRNSLEALASDPREIIMVSEFDRLSSQVLNLQRYIEGHCLIVGQGKIPFPGYRLFLGLVNPGIEGRPGLL